MDKIDVTLPKISAFTLLALSSLFAALSAVSPISVLGIICTAVSTGTCAVVCSSRRNLLPLLCALPGFALAWLFWGTPLIAIAAVIPVICVLPVFFAKRFKLERSTAIAFTAAAFGFGCFLYFMVLVAVKQGGVGIAEIKTFINGILREFETLFAEILGADEQTVADIINNLILLSPGILICIFEITAYLAVGVYSFTCRIFRLDRILLPSYPWKFKMSSVSAYVFCICYLVSVLFGTDRAFSPVIFTAENIIQILTPGFILVGAARSVQRVKTKRGGTLSVIVIVAAFALMFINPFSFFVAVSFIGVIETIIEKFASRAGRDTE